MSRFALRPAAVTLATLALWSWQSAAFGLWAPPVSGCSITLPYAAAYEGKTHHGIDLAADEGAEVHAPVDGNVLFSGRVPADGGGTCWAVTVESADGLRISLMPLVSASVSAGNAVAAGEPVGMLASVGDDSSEESHLHLGLRRGEAYLDPSPFLPAALLDTTQPPVTVAPAVPQPPSETPPAAVSVTAASPAALGENRCSTAPLSEPDESVAAVEEPAARVVGELPATPVEKVVAGPVVSPEIETAPAGRRPSLGFSLPPVKATVSASLLACMGLTCAAIARQRRAACLAR